MTEEELKFCEDYEINVKALQVLNILGDSLTAKGEIERKKLKIRLKNNLDKYLELQS